MNDVLYLINCPCGSNKAFNACCKTKDLANIIQSQPDKEKNISPDWRISTIVQTAEDVPAAFPGGPHHPKGSYVSLCHYSKHSIYGNLGFTTPHSSALSLSIALKSASLATQLKMTISLLDVVSYNGTAKIIKPDNMLFDFFEQCMISVNFAFQSLESYCNSIIYTASNNYFTINRRGETENISKEDVERKCSTEEKISILLPDILQIKNPKGSQIWPNFIKLKNSRDSIIHMKSYDMYSHIKDDPNTLYFNFFDSHPLLFPKFAFGIIWYFSQTKIERHYKPNWVLKFITLLGEEIEKFYSKS